MLEAAESAPGTDQSALIDQHLDLVEFALLKFAEDMNSEVR